MPTSEDQRATIARRGGNIIRIVLVVVTLLYPFIAMLAIRRFGPGALIVVLAVLLVGRALLGLRNAAMTLITWALIAVAAAMLTVALVDGPIAVRLYPVFMNIAMLAAFGATVVRPPSMIERFARLRRADLPPHAIAYTRKATIAWCLFFIANACVSLATTLSGDWMLWTFYNGFLAYVAMALLAGGEWLVRRRVQRLAGE
jgi:uncharacterized membrane protein